MLYRVCEPPVNNPQLEAEIYREMDHSEVNRRFVTDLISAGPVGPRVVDLGCGPALIPILLCEIAETLSEQSEHADRRDELQKLQIMGIDNCIAMLELARLELEFAGRIEQIQLQHIDLNDDKALHHELAETIICNTVLHHLDEPASALRLALWAVRPGGRLFIRDLVRPETEAEVERIVMLYGVPAHDAEPAVERAADQSSVVSPSQLLRQSLHASLTLAEIRKLVADLGIDPKCVNMTSDRHWTLDCQVS